MSQGAIRNETLRYRLTQGRDGLHIYDLDLCYGLTVPWDEVDGLIAALQQCLVEHRADQGNK